MPLVRLVTVEVEYHMPVGTVVLVDLLYSRVPPEPLDVSETTHEVLLLAVVKKVCVLLTTGEIGSASRVTVKVSSVG